MGEVYDDTMFRTRVCYVTHGIPLRVLDARRQLKVEDLGSSCSHMTPAHSWMVVCFDRVFQVMKQH